MLLPAPGGPRTRHREPAGMPPSIIWSMSATPMGRRFIESTARGSPFLRSLHFFVGSEYLLVGEDLDSRLRDAVRMGLRVVRHAAHLLHGEDAREGRTGEDPGEDYHTLRQELLEHVRALKLGVVQFVDEDGGALCLRRRRQEVQEGDSPRVFV